jgi:hypothetical protein
MPKATDGSEFKEKERKEEESWLLEGVPVMRTHVEHEGLRGTIGCFLG